jgi:hypothetical protein
MTDQSQPSLGTVAEEAARLILAMATLKEPGAVPSDDPSHSADPSHNDAPSDGPGPYAGGPAQEPGPPSPEHASRACRDCGAESEGTPVACRLCPLCQGIALLRSVRPETVDRLADFATAVAGTLRDLAAQSRASGPGPGAGSRTGNPSGRATVQDIPVADEEG